MKILTVGLTLALLSNKLIAPMTTMATPPTAPAPIVFFDIAGPDAAELKAFYASIFGWSIDGANGVSTPSLKGTLREDPPETLIYVGVKDVDAALALIVASGGSVVFPRTVLPHVVTFALFKDPAGNRMGLVEQP